MPLPKMPVIENISDTAAWVAAYRALESKRPDALFRDPYAEVLAGNRGDAIVSGIFGGTTLSWSIVVRTAVIDELLLNAVRNKQIDTVLNLAAGLDTRPYRLDLPAALRWIEVDFKPMVEFKEQKLRDYPPRCRLERVSLDLSDRPARQAFFEKLTGEGARRVFVLTEGFLMYLTPDQVEGLARDLHAWPAARLWLQDYVAPHVLRVLSAIWGGVLKRGNSQFKFYPHEGIPFFHKRGWKTLEFRPSIFEARRLRRDLPLGWLVRMAARLSPFNVSRDAGGLLLLEKA